MIEINNLEKQKIDEEFLKGVARNVLKREGEVLDISIVFVKKEKIKELNRKYRKKDEPTDVLSFGSDLNEIVICLEQVKENVEKEGLLFKKELTKVLIHGVLHLLGYEHGDIMETKQKEYLLEV